MPNVTKVAPIFDPAASKLDFSGTPGFELRRLAGVANALTGQMIFSPVVPALKASSVDGAVVSLSFDCTGMHADDPLLVNYAEGAATEFTLDALLAGIGTPSDAAPGTDADSASLIGLFRRALGYLGKLAGTVSSGRLAVTTSAGIATSDGPSTLPPATDILMLVANPGRAFLEVTNTGPNPMSLRFGAAASATQGRILGPGATATYSGAVPTGALHFFSTDGTTAFINVG